MARRGPKPFNNPFVEAAEALKKEIKQAKKAERKARIDKVTGTRTAPSQPTSSPSASTRAQTTTRPATSAKAERTGPDSRPDVIEASAEDRALFLRAVGGRQADRYERPGPRARASSEDRPPRASDDRAAFLDAVGDAKQLNSDPRGVLQPSLPPGNARHVPIYDEEAEALAELERLVDGVTHFDIADTDEFIEGLAEGVDRRLLTKLRKGEFAVQAHLDLHGMRRDDARQAVAEFVDQACRNGHRCIRIVHGRGLNSKDKVPVLKLLLTSWLERGRVGRAVLAFCTARPNDGGAGAVYVLLRR